MTDRTLFDRFICSHIRGATLRPRKRGISPALSFVAGLVLAAIAAMVVLS